ncbi:MAG: DNA polymerase IV [Anaerolineae bacterium]
MSALQRWIIHVDLDAFFASVEELLCPELAGKAIIVGGDPQGRSVVSSASYPARAWGVHSAMPVAQALRLCPHAVRVPPRHHTYGEYSERVMDILRAYTPAVEQISIDEAFLDVTGCEGLWGPPREIGRRIQQQVKEQVRLPVSLGIATTKLVAKIACGEGKPKGLVLVPAGEEQRYLAPLAIDKLWGVGAVTAERLRALGVETIGDLAFWSERQLVVTFGESGRHMYQSARGLDPSPVHESHDRRSISQEVTFAQDVGDPDVIHRNLLRMSDDIASRLRAHGLVAETVRIKLRYPTFQTLTRQVTLPQPTDQGQCIHVATQDLLARTWKAGDPLRLMGVGVSGLLSGSGYQLGLFDGTDQRRARLNETLDCIRGRYGERSIMRASLLQRRGPARDEEPDEEDKG